MKLFCPGVCVSALSPIPAAFEVKDRVVMPPACDPLWLSTVREPRGAMPEPEFDVILTSSTVSVAPTLRYRTAPLPAPSLFMASDDPVAATPSETQVSLVTFIFHEIFSASTRL